MKIQKQFICTQLRGFTDLDLIKSKWAYYHRLKLIPKTLAKTNYRMAEMIILLFLAIFKLETMRNNDNLSRYKSAKTQKIIKRLLFKI